jgi:hypothetical protein
MFSWIRKKRAWFVSRQVLYFILGARTFSISSTNNHPSVIWYWMAILAFFYFDFRGAAKRNVRYLLPSLLV